VACTDDSCDEVNDTVVHTPNNGNCDNGQFCDGAETCDPVNDCQAGTEPCVAWESCNEAGDVCELFPAIFFEDFEGSVPGWTVINNNSQNAVWRFDNPQNRTNYTGGGGEFAIADSDNFQNKDMDTELRTPLLNLSSLITVFLEFKTDFYVYDNIFSGNEIADVDVSTNGISGPWTNVWRKTSNYLFHKTEVIEITTLAAGHADVMIRFHYYDAYNDWWWQIDDVKIRGFCLDSDNDNDGYYSCINDCDDNNPTLNPNTLWYPDFDGDGFGNPTIWLQQCIQPTGPPDYVLNNIDYDDNDSNIGPPTRIDGTDPEYYLTLQEAYDAAGDGAVIQCVEVSFTENLFIDIDKFVAIEGGYDGAYSINSGYTILNGDIDISNGTLTIENFILK
jgi:hypothetical protein